MICDSVSLETSGSWSRQCVLFVFVLICKFLLTGIYSIAGKEYKKLYFQGQYKCAANVFNTLSIWLFRHFCKHFYFSRMSCKCFWMHTVSISTFPWMLLFPGLLFNSRLKPGHTECKCESMWFLKQLHIRIIESFARVIILLLYYNIFLVMKPTISHKWT